MSQTQKVVSDSSKVTPLKTSRPSSAKSQEKNDRKPKTPIRMTPVVKMDSATNIVTLQRTTVVNGQVGSFSSLDLNVSNVPEAVRQVLYAALKLAIAYSNGHDVSASREHIDLGTGVKSVSPSMLTNLQNKVSKLHEQVEVKVSKGAAIPTESVAKEA